MVLSSSTRREKGKRRSGSLIVPLCFLDLLVLLLCSAPGYAHAVPQEQQKESLGSLSSIGEVYVNDSAAPVESTIFSGDRLRTGESGTATFTVSGKGTLKVLPRSEVVFPGNYQFAAELKNGTVVLSSVSKYFRRGNNITGIPGCKDGRTQSPFGLALSRFSGSRRRRRGGRIGPRRGKATSQ